eukprot:COSAG01_NODE_58_length_30193_cov_12.302020_17_plen_65_part_00
MLALRAHLSGGTEDHHLVHACSHLEENNYLSVGHGREGGKEKLAAYANERGGCLRGQAVRLGRA